MQLNTLKALILLLSLATASAIAAPAPPKPAAPVAKPAEPAVPTPKGTLPDWTMAKPPIAKPTVAPSAKPTLAPSAKPVTPTPTPTPVPTAKPAAPAGLPPGSESMPRLDGMATIVMTVKGKDITIELDGTNAPLTAGNFVDLVQRGVYTGTLFHRVVSKPQPFVAQGGDPQSKDSRIPAERYGTGGFIAPGTGQERRIPLEIKPTGATSALYGKSFEVAGVKKPPVLRHRRGAIAMARSANVNSASSQFYFTLSDLDFLDGNYAVFGKVTSGMDVVDQIKQGDRIESAKVTKGAENLRNGGMK
jgi:peptidyl-prolyl cis-trans isomerase B (cyclophilin B)